MFVVIGAMLFGATVAILVSSEKVRKGRVRVFFVCFMSFSTGFISLLPVIIVGMANPPHGYDVVWKLEESIKIVPRGNDKGRMYYVAIPGHSHTSYTVLYKESSGMEELVHLPISTTKIIQGVLQEESRVEVYKDRPVNMSYLLWRLEHVPATRYIIYIPHKSLRL